MFRLEINDPTDAEAPKLCLPSNQHCIRGGRISKPQFRSSSATAAKDSGIRPKHVDRNKNVSSARRTIPVKDAQIEKKGNQNAPTVRSHMLHLIKGVQNTKHRHSGNMWSITKKHIPQLSAKTLSHSPRPQMRHLLSRPNSSLNS